MGIIDGADLSFTFDILKVDRERRLVTGIATAENVDLADDVVDFEASLNAFSKWIGNIREMHSPIAVGKMVSYRPTQITFTGKTYRAIEVTVYISKGAEDTWQKVLDGTLSGFSIGGRVLKKESDFDKEGGRTVNVIKEYELGELSLVDSPCNPAAKISMVKKSADGQLVYDGGENMSKDLQNKNDADIVTDVELNDAQKEGLVKRMVSVLFGGESETLAKDAVTTSNSIVYGTTSGGYDTTTWTLPTTPNININVNPFDIAKGYKEDAKKSEDMEDEEETDEEVEKAEEESTEKVEKSEEEASDSVEKAEDDTDGGEDMDFEKLSEVLGSLLDDKLTTLKSEIAEEVDGKIEKAVGEVTEKVDATQASLEETKEEVAKVSDTGAMKKSVDTEDEVDDEETVEKSVESESFWGGVFVPTELAKALGYES